MEQARRDLMEAEEKLAIKREEEKNNRAVMNGKWEELRSKETLLKESFISFNKVIIELAIIRWANTLFRILKHLKIILTKCLKLDVLIIKNSC